MYKHIIYMGLTATLLAGCKTMTHHTNTLYFGTSTTVGVKVGASQTSVPSVQIGYDRQEGVAMPLLANRDFDNDNIPDPCGKDNDTNLTGCMFRGTQGVDTDTYSVLASFGADIKGSGRTNGVEAGVGLAQYFATGHAAIALAENGGAAVVSTGLAAAESAKAAAEISAAKKYYNSDKGKESRVVAREAADKNFTDLVAAIQAKGADPSVKNKMTVAAPIALGKLTSRPLVTACATKVNCIAHLNSNKNNYLADAGRILTQFNKP